MKVYTVTIAVRDGGDISMRVSCDRVIHDSHDWRTFDGACAYLSRLLATHAHGATEPVTPTPLPDVSVGGEERP